MPEFLAGLGSDCALTWFALVPFAVLLVVGLWCERKKRTAIKAELSESRSRYRAIFETAVDAIIVSDQHGIIREFSRADDHRWQPYLTLGYRTRAAGGHQ
jgi:PAS domain-containing protein